MWQEKHFVRDGNGWTLIDIILWGFLCKTWYRTHFDAYTVESYWHHEVLNVMVEWVVYSFFLDEILCFRSTQLPEWNMMGMIFLWFRQTMFFSSPDFICCIVKYFYLLVCENLCKIFLVFFLPHCLHRLAHVLFFFLDSEPLAFNPITFLSILFRGRVPLFYRSVFHSSHLF